MKFPCLIVVLAIVHAFGLISPASGASDNPRSLALKDRSPERNPFHINPDHSADELWDEFMLVKNANSGDPVAQHDLGLRYLLGKGFRADTVKAYHWIQKAAEQNLVPARYNLGILQNNGWGTPWDPFEAYRNFQYAALHELVEAKYIYGLLRSDNLVVPRNFTEAYRWVKAAADSGYEPARETLPEFEKRGITSRSPAPAGDSSGTAGRNRTSNQRKRSTLQPVYLDLASDSARVPDNRMLLQEALHAGRGQPDSAQISAESGNVDTTLNSFILQSLHESAEAGSPEALTLIGRCYEQGTGVPRDLIQASVYYLRAIRFDSPWAPMLLWKMTQDPGYFHELKRHVDGHDPIAGFVWAGLTAFGFDHQLTDAQALDLLEFAASKNLPDAMVELGMCHYAGFWVSRDPKQALALMQDAEELGSREAAVRICMIELMGEDMASREAGLLKTLQRSAADGSVLAQAMLGYCFQEGRGVPVNIPEAVQLYRKAAQRGNRIAFNALKKLYDDRRPPDPEFQIQDSPDE